MSISTADAIKTFATEAQDALTSLRGSLPAIRAARIRSEERPTTAEAVNRAAREIFGAEGRYSQACLQTLSRGLGSASDAITLRAVGDAVLGLAASDFRNAVKGEYIDDDSIAQKLLDCVRGSSLR
jgi:hypothetical protein